MSIQRQSVLVAITIVLVAAASRILPHPYNFTPIGAMAIFGGAMSGKHKMLFPLSLLALWFSDLLLNNIVYPSWYPEYYNTFKWFGHFSVYISFSLMSVLGLLFLRKVNAKKLVFTSLLGSVLFFGITNFEVWLMGNLYPQNASGLAAAYIAGLPFASMELAAPFGFLGNTIFGDLCYNFLFFGVFALLQQKIQPKIA